MRLPQWLQPKQAASAGQTVSVADRWIAAESAVLSKKLKVSDSLLAWARQKPDAEKYELKRYEPAPGVVPKDKVSDAMAQDNTPYPYINGFAGFGCNNGFPGYPFLADLTQLPEYRKMVSTLAEEMTRKWISLRSTAPADSGEDKNDRIQRLEVALRRYRVREHFRKVAEHDGYFGRGQLYIDVTMPGSKTLAADDEKELETPLFLSDKKITKGSLVGFRTVEPMWTYPGIYNSTNPLLKGYYKPSAWYVMGNIVHDSRMLLFISRPLPDMLKAAYSFGGISLSQLAKPYIDHWIRTRNSVSDLVHSFSTSGIATNMQAELSGDGQGDIFKRAELFNLARDNRGVMLLDKESEEFFQFNTPLSGLDALQAQAQEQMSAVSSIPLVKLLGITPTGLNASSDGEIRVFYDYIHSMQENLYREPLKRVLDIIQLSEFGNIDPDIDFVFEPLYQLSELELANTRKAEAETGQVLINGGVISQEEERVRLAGDPDSPYQSLDTSDVPELDTDTSEEEEGEGTESVDTKGTAGK